jgi:ubiquinone/menaquinone biosynthesis C-methylase UbiE
VYRFVTGTESEQVGMMSERSGWQLADASVAEANERYLMSTFGYAWAQALVQLAAPQEGDRLLDVACGTGPVARQAAPFVGPTGRVVGLYLNAGMLEIARSYAHSGRHLGGMATRERDCAAIPECQF